MNQFFAWHNKWRGWYRINFQMEEEYLPSAPQAEKILNTSGALGPEGPKVQSFSAAGGENLEHHWHFGARRMLLLWCKRDIMYFQNMFTVQTWHNLFPQRRDIFNPFSLPSVTCLLLWCKRDIIYFQKHVSWKYRDIIKVQTWHH